MRRDLKMVRIHIYTLIIGFVKMYLNNGKNGWIEDDADQFVNVNMCKEIQLKREPEVASE